MMHNQERVIAAYVAVLTNPEFAESIESDTAACRILRLAKNLGRRSSRHNRFARKITKFS